MDNPFLEHLQAVVHDLSEIDRPPFRRLPPDKSKEWFITLVIRSTCVTIVARPFFIPSSAVR